MKYIVLAAGRGERLHPYTKHEPKILLRFGRYPLIKYHSMYAHLAGIDDMVMVTGYRSELVDYPWFKYYVNDDWSNSNMVKSLLDTARDEFNDHAVVSYGDILYRSEYAKKISETSGAFVVAVDMHWENYWIKRYGNLNDDMESLYINKDGFIEDIGRKINNDKEIELPDARYVGLMKFSDLGLLKIRRIYDEDPMKWRRAYMTDMLQELINRGEEIIPFKVENGWLEFDTTDDYANAMKWYVDGTLKSELNLEV